MVRSFGKPWLIPAVSVIAGIAAPVMTFADSQTFSSGSYTLPTSSTADDVLLGAVPAQMYYVGYGGGVKTDPNSARGSEGSSTNWATLTDGTYGTAPYNSSSVVTPYTGDSATYYLANVNTNPYGVNINTFDMISVWGDNGRADQNFTILYSTTANSSSFQTLATVTTNFSQQANGNPFYEFTSTSANVTNVARLQINFGTQENGYVGYQELLAHGAVATSGTAIAPQSSGLIPNGDFSTPTYPNDGSANYTVIPGWVSSGLAQTGVNNNNGPFAPAGGPTIPGGGSQFAFIQVRNAGTGTLGEKLDNLVIGQQYDLTYWISQRNGNNITSTLQPAIDGQLIGSADLPGTGWTEESYNFTYTGSDPSPYLNFIDTNTDGIDETIDLSDVQLTAVPEPTSLGLLSVAALGLLRRRRA